MNSRIITEELLQTLRLEPHSSKKHPVRVMVEQMEKGQILRIYRSDFNWKGRTPMLFIKPLEKDGKKKFQLFREAKVGWVVKRVE